MWRQILGTAWVVAALGCSSGAATGVQGGTDAGAEASGPRVCVPGASVACACSTGATGAQVCNGAGTALGTCVCGLQDAGADHKTGTPAAVTIWTCSFVEGPPHNNSACMCQAQYKFGDASSSGSCPVGSTSTDAGVQVPADAGTDRCCVQHTDDAGSETCNCLYGPPAFAACAASHYLPVSSCPPPQ